MNEKALKIVNALIPSKLIAEVVKSTETSKKDVVNIAIELTNKITEKEDIDKQSLEQTIKNLVRSDALLAFLDELNNKYSISKETSSKILTVMLPAVYKNFLQIDDSLFKKEEIKEEKPTIVEEPKIEPAPVDDVLKNIENKAKEEQIEEEPKKKKKLALFKKKEKVLVEEKEEKVEEKTEEISSEKGSLLNTICSIIVLISFIALLAIVIVLVIKQKTI